MPLRVLIVPDKFKGTLTATEAAQAIARGWRKTRPADQLTLLPMSDGGDGFGKILARHLGARVQKVRTVDAAHRPLMTTWWWEPRRRTGIVESARVIGLALLPRGRFHPFELDTFGLGAVLQAAAKKGARRCIIGIGGSATNDGGFGLARALGWRFLGRDGSEINSWPELARLQKILPPKTQDELLASVATTVAMDVQNRLLGPRGCTRVFGPQKGLQTLEFPPAETALRRLAVEVRHLLCRDFARIPGAGAAGGLGFGLMAFSRAKPESGFTLFAELAQLAKQIRRADLIVTGEGSLDRSTLMGKGVGELAVLCRKLGKPCLGIGGRAGERPLLRQRFAGVLALVDFATDTEALRRPAFWLEVAATETARTLVTNGVKAGLHRARQRE